MEKGSGINSNPPTYHSRKTKINAGWVTTFNNYAIVSENESPEEFLMERFIWLCNYNCLWYGYNDAKIKPNDNLLIIGAGNLGLQ